MSIALTEEKTSLTAAPAPATDAVPAILRELNARGWAAYQGIPFPTRTDEAWRFTNLKAIDLASYTHTVPAADAVKTALAERSVGLDEISGKMVFVNDELVSQTVLSDTLRQQGVIWKPLAQAAADHPELLAKYFMTNETRLGSAKFAALHQSAVRNGTFLYVPAGVKIDLPIEVFHWASGANNTSFPHTLLVVEANAKVTLVDYFGSEEGEQSHLAIGVNDLHVAEGADLTYIAVQEWNEKSLSFQINHTTVAKAGSAKSLNVNLGSRYARTENLSRLTGEGARSDMLAMTAATGSQEFDQRTLQEHAAPGAYSDLLYKNTLDNESRTIVAGLIKVDEGAHRTDAYQKVRNLLLSDDAEANSAPGLEILADDVRCSHGATSGQIEKEELFYMLARGIDKRTAQRLIVHGFLSETMDRLESPVLSASIGQRLTRKFSR